jgi:hypothetical protein
MRVAAGDQRRHARQRQPHQPVSRPLEDGAVPSVRHPDLQVHVIGEQRPAVGRQAAGDGEVVAADGGFAALNAQLPICFVEPTPKRT